MSRLCLNCSEPLTGRFCATCGQEDVEDPSFSRMVGSLLGDLLDLDSRLWLTLKLLFTRPGRLSVEYRSGRRARYIAPVRLYLIGSVVFFAAVATADVQVVHVSGGGAASAAESARTDTAAAAPEADAGSGARSTWITGALQAAGAQPDRLNQQFVRALAWVMFVLIPVFAMLLKGLHRKSGILYLHHLVFALHFHTFGFLTMAVSFATVRFTPGAQSPAAVVVMGSSQIANALYLYLAARRFYEERPARTVARLAALGFGYLLAVAAGMTATLAVVLLLFFGQG